MSIYYVKESRQKEHFLVTDAAPVYIPASAISANDMSALHAWFEVADCSAGINAVTPGTVEFQYSPDDEATWVTLPGQAGGTIEGNGVDWQLGITSNTGTFPPVLRYKFTAPAGESYRVLHIRRIHTLPGTYYSPLSAGAGTSVLGFGAVASANRVAAMIGAPTVLPVPSASGFDYVTTTAITKSVANDGRALDVNITNTSTPTTVKYDRNGSLTTPKLDTTTAANNRPFPTVILAGDSLDPLAMGTGADGANVQRVTLSTRHETVGTPISIRPSDGTNFLSWITVAGNTQHSTNSASYRVPTSSITLGFDAVGARHVEMATDANGYQKTIGMHALVPAVYDYIGVNVSGATTDIYTYKTGGAGGTTVATITINYSGVDKATITSVART